MVRHLMSGDAELDGGEPIVDKSRFAFVEDGQDESLAEVGGDLVIQELQRPVGAVGRADDAFTERARHFAYTHPAPDGVRNGPNSAQAANAWTDDLPKKTSFLGRSFGKK